MKDKIILASQSPRRKQLLEWAEVPFEVVVKETDEHFPPGLSAEEVALYIARNKSIAVQSSLQDTASSANPFTARKRSVSCLLYPAKNTA
jgi:septum formation protein